MWADLTEDCSNIQLHAIKVNEYNGVMDILQERGRKAIDELMDKAEMYANKAMTQNGNVPPCLFIHCDDGIAAFKQQDPSNVEGKDTFAGNARMLCAAHGAVATVLVSEAWVRWTKTDARLELSVPHSELCDRQEVVLFLCESRFDKVQKMVRIGRKEDGKFIGFDQTPKISYGPIEGRFGQLLSPMFPDQEERTQAKNILKSKRIAAEWVEQRTTGTREKSKYHVISPDGIPLTPEPFGSRKEAQEFIPKWCERFKAQGYYAAVRERIHLDDLVDRLAIVSEAEFIEAIEAAAKQRGRERGRGMAQGI